MTRAILAVVLLVNSLPAFAEQKKALESAAAVSEAAAHSADPNRAAALSGRPFGSGLEFRTADVIRARHGAKEAPALNPSKVSYGKVEIPSVPREFDPKERGWSGFKNGFGKAFAWVQTPADKITQLGYRQGEYFIQPNAGFFPALAGGVVVGLLLAPVGLVAGLGRGLFGAIFGERKY